MIRPIQCLRCSCKGSRQAIQWGKAAAGRRRDTAWADLSQKE
ncbi:hypothetical protein ACTQ4E_09675 [Lawsonibacter sp. LCP25S3_G6]